MRGLRGYTRAERTRSSVGRTERSATPSLIIGIETADDAGLFRTISRSVQTIDLTSGQCAALLWRARRHLLSEGGNQRPLKLSRRFADFLILLRNLHICGFTLLLLSPLSALRCALVVTGQRTDPGVK